MDHLPVPKNAITKKRAIVPYVCLKDYDGGPFLTYPIREGVTHALPPDGNIPGGSPYSQHERTYPTPKQEQEDFLQRWLFFGLIHEILGDRYKPKDFIVTFETGNGETTIIQTPDLVEILDKWVVDIRANCVNPRHTYEHIAECLRLAFATLHGTGPDFDSRIKVSLASIGELFTFAANEAYGPKTNKCPNTFCYLIDYEDWKNTMLSSGWCPSQVKVIFDEIMSLQTRHFLRFLDSPTSDRLHRRCSNDQCLAYQNDLTRYHTKHLYGCNCEHLSIDMRRLTEILKGGSLPLVRIRRGHTLDQLSVELVPSQSTSHYIALSHVWADGLGNPYENALPRCQLDFLQQTITEYYAKLDPQPAQEILLWCDVLCCPAEPGEAKDLALAQMRRPYLEAIRVLVLDASLRVYDLKAMDTDEACLRILNSGWTRRLWTLQEGALPATNFRLAILFKDEAININRLLAMISQASKLSIGRKGLAADIISRIVNIVNVSYEADGDQHADLGSVEAGLRYRSVSVPSDEPLLIANLLDLDVNYILNGPCPLANCTDVVGCDHSRIHRLWSLMPTAFRGVPRTVLFRIGPRLSESGFRWAPATLLYNEVANTTLQPRLISEDEDTSITNSRSIYSFRHLFISMLPPSLPMLLSTFWKPTADFLFWIRARLEAFGWASAIPGNLRRTNAVTGSTGRGIPTSRGLLVRLTGYSLSKAQCPSGIPSNPWNVIRQQDDLYYIRGVGGEWYMINRRLPPERDSFLSSKSIYKTIDEEDCLWITHLESGFNDPKLVAEAKGGQQVTTGLLVQLLSDEEGIKYVQSKVHVNIGLVQESVRNMLETAYQCAQQVSRRVPAIRVAANPDGLQDKVNDTNSPQYEAILILLGQEIHRVATQNASPKVAAATGLFSKQGFGLFKSVIAMMVVGGYGCLGRKTADSQEWCFD